MKLIIEAIEKELQAQKDEIFFKDLQIKELKENVERAEMERDKAVYELKRVLNGEGATE